MAAPSNSTQPKAALRSAPKRRRGHYGSSLADSVDHGVAEAGVAMGRVIEPRNVSAFYVGVFQSTPAERIAIVKAGLPATKAKQILGELDLPTERLYRALDISVSTLNRKAKNAEALPIGESERVLGLAKLIGQVQTMVEESGNPVSFDASAWTSQWLNEPLAALAGQRPVDFLDTMEGQGLVSDTLARIQSGAYA